MTVATKEAVEQQQYLTFLLANEECAISILKVREIIGYDAVTTVPKMPQWVTGVINLLGSVVPVVDLTAKFGMEQKPVLRAQHCEANHSGTFVALCLFSKVASPSWKILITFPL